MLRLLPARSLRATGAFAVALAAACQSDPSATTVDVVASTPPPVTPVTIDWVGAPDCRARLRLLERAARTERLPKDPSAVPIAVQAMPTSGDWFTATDPGTDWIQPDLPVRILPAHAPPTDDVGCWIEVGPARELESELAEVGREQVRSAYQTGSKSERNPEYELAQLRVRQAEKELKDSASGIIAVGDPMLDLVGLMVGSVFDAFSGRAGRKELEEAIATLAATQRSIERPVWRHYHFERTLFRGRKSAVVPIVLRGRGGPERRTMIRQRERRTFEVLDGLDPRDRDYAAHDAASMSELELERWKARPPTIPVSALVRILIDPTAPQPEELAPPPGSTDPIETLPRGPTEVASADPEPVVREPASTALPTSIQAGALHRQTTPPEAASLEALKGSPAPRAVPVAIPKPPAPLPTAPWESEAADRGEWPDVVTLRRNAVDRGLGVYLSPHTVLTTARVVGDARALEARRDGILLPALVAARDPARDLALVRLPRAGRAVALHQDPAFDAPLSLLAAGSPAPATPASTADLQAGAGRLRLDLAPATTPPLGAPLLSEGRLVGIVTMVEGRTAVAASGRTIRALLDQLPDSDLLLD